MEDLYEEGARSNEARLRAIGLPLDDIAHFPFPMDVPPRERAAPRRWRCCAPASSASATARPPRDPETLRVFFDLLARNARGEEVPRGTTIQWDFRDAEPWYLLLDGADKRAVQGRVAKPTVRLRMRFDDFAELVSRRARPYELVARGRLRPCGDPRVLLKLQRSVRLTPPRGGALRVGSAHAATGSHLPLRARRHRVRRGRAAHRVVVPAWLRGQRRRRGVDRRRGSSSLSIAASTEGPSSLVNSIPIAVHVLLDYALAAILVASPFLFGFSDESAPTAFFIVLGVAHLLITIGTRFRTPKES